LGIKKTAMTHRTANIAGAATVVVTTLGSIGLAFWIAVNTFWWCPEGGCSLASAAAKVSLLTNVAGLVILFVTLGLGFWFGCAAILSLLCQKSVAEQVFLPSQRPLAAWYKSLMQAWLSRLWP
jgi:hypothetical protein